VSDPIARAEAILRAACGDRLHTALPMAPLTTFRIGGPAALYLEPNDDGDLAAVAAAVAEGGIPTVVIGKGSNVLVSDAGFAGLVLRLGRGFRWAARDGTRLSAGGAMPLPALAGIALRHDLAGLEFGVAIPASLGGAVKMNAGAHGRSLSEVVDGIDLVRIDTGERISMSNAEAVFAYRRSALPGGAVVVGAQVALSQGEPEGIRERMDEARAWRRRTQPVAEPNCGSVFKNPEGEHAARLIESAGAKGLAVGGASVSAKHANFIVAAPGTRAADVVELMARVRERVASDAGVELEPEVQLIGAFDHVH
jgi:UDP-N-acetylmuramate dehydrogenase